MEDPLVSLLVCPYCRGAKYNRHEKPPEITQAFWDKTVGPLGLCLLCKGHGKVGQSLFNEAGETGVFFLKAIDPPRILASCMEGRCRKWADATKFFDPEGMKAKHAIIRCPSGHEMEFELCP
jgi:uncharacterized protein YbaR (Trm112 family)